MDETIRREKELNCFPFIFLDYLHEIKLNYVSVPLVFIIIIISIFGRIKFQYRWYMLNLALIDFLQIYDFTCTKDASLIFICYFNDNLRNFISFTDLFYKLPCIGFFILTGSRFLAVFYSRLYKKLEKSWKTILVIVLINMIYFGICYLKYNGFLRLAFARTQTCLPYLTQKIFEFENITCTEGSINEISGTCDLLRVQYFNICQENFNPTWQWFFIVDKIEQATPVIAFICSVIFVSFMVAKIAKQVKFQTSTNKEALKTNIRIISVLMIQAAILLFLCVLDFIFELQRSYVYDLRYKFPCWLYWMTDKERTIKGFREIRIFIDSLVVLGFMTGYRENIIAFISWCYRNIRKPFKVYPKKPSHAFITII